MKIGDRLKEMRNDESIYHVAENTGLSFMQIIVIEENNRIPTPKIQKMLVEYYGYTMKDLFPENEVTGRAFVCGKNGCKLVENFNPRIKNV